MSPEIKIRRAEKVDVKEIAELMHRLKKLNEEFDINFKVSKDADKRIPEYLNKAVEEKQKCLIFVATVDARPVAMLKADLRERIFYDPPVDVRITDLYILPEYRRSRLGNRLISALKDEMSKLGFTLLTVEFPAFNIIAKNFYAREGFKDNIAVLRLVGKGFAQE